ncbi:G1 S-specific cyclin D [Olea europaea subsp. europaea]|uniref:G1 S-specific cyclin D n=1 Tax=Olea europaea subsp. europaea TaxID=158383 RepID=A0A8S0PDV0_OLEEU|nr:G1 S-specific cyclin D [Olea europaea subsp. europaea]
MASDQPNFPLALDALYCEEEHWDNGGVENREEESRFLSDFVNCQRPVVLLEQDLFWEDEELSTLLSKEQENELYNGIQENPSLAKARGEAVEWMLKVIEYYSFSALTAVLAVNYLDRFLCGFHSHNEKPWMTQLAAVACLSLAAKVEETQVPLLLDFQVEESKYVFEAKTIQRMEILVLSILQWKMNPVTPLSFLDYIARRLGLKSNLCFEFLRRCECLLLSIIADYRFMCYLPSTLANATMLYIFSSLQSCIGIEYQDQLLGITGIDKDKVEECSSLIQEVATRIQFHSLNKRKFGSLPGSPKGVVDVSFSFDSSNYSWEVCTSAATSVSSSPEPLSKKIKNLHTSNEADTFSYSHQVQD